MMRHAQMQVPTLVFDPRNVAVTRNNTLKRRSLAASNPASRNIQDHFAGHDQQRDARLLNQLGRMSPEEQLDKFLRSVQQVHGQQMNEADDNTEYDDYAIIDKPKGNSSTTLELAKWHSMDSIGDSAKKDPKRYSMIRRKMSADQSRERTDAPRTFASVSQPDDNDQDKNSKQQDPQKKQHVSLRMFKAKLGKPMSQMPSISPHQMMPKQISTGSSSATTSGTESSMNHHLKGSGGDSMSITDDDDYQVLNDGDNLVGASEPVIDQDQMTIYSCSCTDVTLDENNCIVHNHNDVINKNLNNHRPAAATIPRTINPFPDNTSQATPVSLPCSFG